MGLREQFIEDVGGHLPAIREILSTVDEDEACSTLAKAYAEYLKVSTDMTRQEMIVTIAALIDVILEAIFRQCVLSQEPSANEAEIVPFMVLGIAAALRNFAKEVARNIHTNKEHIRIMILAVLINTLSAAIAMDTFEENASEEKIN